MKFFIEVLLWSLSIVGIVEMLESTGDKKPRNSHFVPHTDYCGSQCKYYNEECPIRTIMVPGPGYDCNKGYCRLPSTNDCIAVDKNAVYADNVDACGSLCKYAGGCTIRPGEAMPAGFNCKEGYCRRDSSSKCIRQICYKKTEF